VAFADRRHVTVQGAPVDTSNTPIPEILVSHVLWRFENHEKVENSRILEITLHKRSMIAVPGKGPLMGTMVMGNPDANWIIVVGRRVA